MTIHIVSIAALSPAAAAAMRRGVEVECAGCGGKGHVEGPCDISRELPMAGDLKLCATCMFRGRVRFWDLTTGPLAGWKTCNAPHIYEIMLRRSVVVPELAASDPLTAALAAIRPGDVLVHDGTELGQRCAEVVAKVANERKGE